MENIDWSRFRKRIHLGKAPADVYWAWAVPAEIERWFLKQAHYFDMQKQRRPADQPVRTGDTFTWSWHNWEFEQRGDILEANGRNRLAFTFGQYGQVSVDLKPGDGGTELTLVQHDIPTGERSKFKAYVGCATGWTFWLANLKVWLEHGITLHATGLQATDTADLVNS